MRTYIRMHFTYGTAYASGAVHQLKYVLVSTYARARTCTYARAYVCKYAAPYVHTYGHMYVFACTRACTHTCACVHTFSHARLQMFIGTPAGSHHEDHPSGNKGVNSDLQTGLDFLGKLKFKNPVPMPKPIPSRMLKNYVFSSGWFWHR